MPGPSAGSSIAFDPTWSCSLIPSVGTTIDAAQLAVLFDWIVQWVGVPA